MTRAEMRRYWEAYTDAWRLFQRFSRPSEDSAFWDALIEESRRLDEKHHTRLFRELLMATVNEIERRGKHETTDGER